MVKIVVEKEMRASDVATFIELSKELVKGSRAEEGNIVYEVKLGRVGENVKIRFFEIWTSEAYVQDVHIGSKHVENTVPKLKELYVDEMFEMWTKIEHVTDDSGIMQLEKLVKIDYDSPKCIEEVVSILFG